MRTLILFLAVVFIFTGSVAEAGNWRGVICSAVALQKAPRCENGFCPLIQRPILPRVEVETTVEETTVETTVVRYERPRRVLRFLQRLRNFRLFR